MSKHKRDMAQYPSSPSNIQPAPIYIIDSSPETSPLPRPITLAAFQPRTMKVENHHPETITNSNGDLQNRRIENGQNTHMYNGNMQNTHMENTHIQNGQAQGGFMHSGHTSDYPMPGGYQNGHMLNTHVQNVYTQIEDMGNGSEQHRQIQIEQNGHLQNSYMQNSDTQNGYSQVQKMVVAEVPNSTHRDQIQKSAVQVHQPQVKIPRLTNDINVYVRAIKRVRQHLQSRGKKALLTAITPIVPPKSRHILSFSNETLINIMQRLAPASSARFSATCRQLKSLQALLHEDTHYTRALTHIRQHLSSRGKRALLQSLTSTTAPERRHILLLNNETLINIMNRLTPISSASLSATCKQLKPLHSVLYKNTPHTFSRCMNSLEICRWRVREVQNVEKQRAGLRELVREATIAKQELKRKIKKNQEKKNNNRKHMSEEDLKAHEKALSEAAEMEEEARRAVAVLNKEMDSWAWPKRDDADRMSSKIIDGTVTFEKGKKGIPASKNGLGALACLDRRNMANERV